MVAVITDDQPTGNEDEDIVREAVERFKACEDWEGVQDERSREDIKFANADPRNLWQWPDKIYEQISGDQDLPCLTINNTRVHNDMIINDLSKNAYGVKVRPVGGKASYKSAEQYQKLIRRTENISRASTQYRKVAEHQVDGGIGYILLETRYVSERSFDQDIYLKAARDPTAVKLDPWIHETDGSDAKFGFVFERMPRKEFNRKYPEWKNKVGLQPIDSAFSSWITDKEIVVAKYFRKNPKNDLLVGFKDENGNEIEMLRSEIKEQAGKEVYKALLEQIDNGVLDGQTRSVTNDEVQWFLIAGDTIIDRGDWAGKFVPIFRCVGREVVIDATLDRKGHTRPMIDAQHMLNYNASVDVQTMAFQPKAMFSAPMRALEGQEQWKTLNINGFPVLLWNDIDDEASGELQRVEGPIRLDPPKVNAATLQGMQNAERQMMMISGQFQAQMGENDTQSAASGKAINERQAQGDTATYHFVEHMADMKRFLGNALIDLYPKIYDTKRVLTDLGDDGEEVWIHIDPDQSDVTDEIEELQDDALISKIVLNPRLGEHMCISDPGPSYASQRQEAWNAISLILQQSKELVGVCGDLLFKVGDFPYADEIMERLQKEIKATKPYLFEKDPGSIAAQQQMQKLTALNVELTQKLAEMQLRLRGREERRDIEAFNAETDRMKATIDFLTKVILTPQQQAQMQHELEAKAHDHVYEMIQQANEPEVDEKPAQ